MPSGLVNCGIAKLQRTKQPTIILLLSNYKLKINMSEPKYCWNCYLTGPAKDGNKLKDEYFCKYGEKCSYCKEIETTPMGKIINSKETAEEVAVIATYKSKPNGGKMIRVK